MARTRYRTIASLTPGHSGIQIAENPSVTQALHQVIGGVCEAA